MRDPRRILSVPSSEGSEPHDGSPFALLGQTLRVVYRARDAQDDMSLASPLSVRA